MLRLTPEQIQLKLDFMDDYVRAHNAADYEIGRASCRERV